MVLLCLGRERAAPGCGVLPEGRGLSRGHPQQGPVEGLMRHAELGAPSCPGGGEGLAGLRKECVACE